MFEADLSQQSGANAFIAVNTNCDCLLKYVNIINHFDNVSNTMELKSVLAICVRTWNW